MKRSISLILVLTLCILFAMYTQAESEQDRTDLADQNDVDTVMIALTKLDVNDHNLELSWKIRNNTDHDVWVCSPSPQNPSVYEYFLDKDAETLVLRRRSDLPMREELTMKYPPLRSRYVRLRSGQEKAESISLAVPVRPYRISEGESGNAEYAGRLALEIGFYNEDLPGLILHIVEIAEKLNYDFNVGFPDSNDLEIIDRFFGGWSITQSFKHLLGFSESVTSAASGGDELNIHYMGPVLNGEQILRLEVDGAHIPYGSAPAAEETANDEVEDTPITIALTKLDVNDTILELSYKIKNSSDHDIWVCDSVHVYQGFDFEVYLSEDGQTLLIRKRLDVPTEVVWMECPTGRYVRLRPGQERVESFSLTVPVHPSRVFASGRSTADHARRLVLEIGFYNEDLPGMIRGVLEVAEKLNCARLEPIEYETAIFKRYFNGIWIEHLFGGLSGFEEYTYKDGSEQILIPYTWQFFKGERFSQIVIDGVYIPYEQ